MVNRVSADVGHKEKANPEKDWLFKYFDFVFSYKVSVIMVSIDVVSISIIIVSVSIVMVVESSIAASSEGLLVQEANAIMPATNANASTFFIFCSVNKVFDGTNVLRKNDLQNYFGCIFPRT